jgi:hypothetical protein
MVIIQTLIGNINGGQLYIMSIQVMEGLSLKKIKKVYIVRQTG